MYLLNRALTIGFISSAVLSVAAFAQDQTSTIPSDTAAVAAEAPVVVALTYEERVAAALEQAFVDAGMQDFADFYATRDFRPIWADAGNATLLELLTFLETAPDHGLPLVRYNTAAIEAAWNGSVVPEDVAALEVAAARAYVQFAKDLRAGMLEPCTINKEMNSEHRVPDTAVVLAEVAEVADRGGDRGAVYAAQQPSSPEYALMLAEKKRLEKLVAGSVAGTRVPEGRTLRPGHNNRRVAALRVRLKELGYTVGDLASTVYDDALIEVVKQFQRDAGLNDDGLVGPQTLAAVNTGPETHLKQVIVNLERLRWMNFDLGKRHIYVNIPEYMARVVDDGKTTLSFRVVVGTRANQTAEFSDTMTHMIVNPTWHVPSSIASKEYLPKLQADPTALQRAGIRMLVRGTGEVVDSSTVDYTQYSQDNFPFVLQQPPGSYNALGRVKFMFPNKYNIYLHDTPSRRLFERDARAYSHGCVRVQKPLELAYTLLAPQEADPQSRFDSVLATRRETQIDLVEPIPVHLVYRTAFFDENGEINYRVDIYRRDRLVFDALAKAGVTIPGMGG